MLGPAKRSSLINWDQISLKALVLLDLDQAVIDLDISKYKNVWIIHDEN